MSLRILIADDHAILRNGVRSLVAECDRLEIVGEAADGMEALRLVDALHPDILILDIAMPRMSGLEALREIAKLPAPRPKVFVLSAHGEREYVVEALRGGAAGFLVKDAAFDDLLRAIDAVASGRRYLGAGVSELALDGFLGDSSRGAQSTAGQTSDLDKLSPREREVLRLIAESRTNDEIASRLHISIHTVQTYRKRLMEKLGLNRAIDLARFALRHGLATLE